MNSLLNYKSNNKGIKVEMDALIKLKFYRSQTINMQTRNENEDFLTINMYLFLYFSLVYYL